MLKFLQVETKSRVGQVEWSDSIDFVVGQVRVLDAKKAELAKIVAEEQEEEVGRCGQVRGKRRRDGEVEMAKRKTLRLLANQ